MDFKIALLFGLCIQMLYASESEHVKEIGNGVSASKSGVEVPGVTFLLDDLILSEGVLFAYSAFFRSDSPVRFQVWRPMNEDKTDDGRMFRLVGETKVIPSVQYAREDVYIASKLTEKCVKVSHGDRLGIYLEEAPGAVAYTFDPNDPMALGHRVKDVNFPVKVNETVNFDTLTFPYDFSMTAYVDTDLSKYSGMGELFECPEGLLIPSYIQPTLAPTIPPTGRPGATGATGPRGIIGLTGQIGATGVPGATGPEGATGATGPQGNLGATGPEGPVGNTGYTGPYGATGATGAQGEKGDKGDQGPRGPPGAAVVVDENGLPVLESLESDDDNNILKLILLAWLALVTIVLIIILIIVIRMMRKDKYPRERLPSVGSDFKPSWIGTLTPEERKDWQGTLKSVEEKEYDQGTLRSDDCEKGSEKSSGVPSDIVDPRAPYTTPASRESVPAYTFEPNTEALPSFQYDSETLSSSGGTESSEKNLVS